jgi:hypothetical protein
VHQALADRIHASTRPSFGAVAPSIRESQHAKAKPRSTFVRSLQTCDVELLHLKHRLHNSICLFRILILEQFL